MRKILLLCALPFLAAVFNAEAQTRSGRAFGVITGECSNADVGVTLETVCTITLGGQYETMMLTLSTATQNLDQLCIRIDTTTNADCDYGPTSASPDSANGAFTSPQGWLYASGHDGGSDCDQLTTSDGTCKLHFVNLSGVQTIRVTAAAAVTGAVVTGTYRAGSG